MKGTSIIVSAHPEGTFDEGLLNGTVFPGTVMEMDDTIPAVGRAFTWQVYGKAAADGGQGVTDHGDRKVVAVTIESPGEGKTYDFLYPNGSRLALYFPKKGELLNMRIIGSSSYIIGSELMINNGSGQLLLRDADAEAHPFTSLEAADDPDLLWCRFNGSAG